MKTTSFEISKKLAEIGFEVNTRYYYNADAKCISRGEDPDDYELTFINCYSEIAERINVPAYDLETILEALPACLSNDFEGVDGYLRIAKFQMSYKDDEGYYVMVGNTELMEYCYDSLTDAAARLLIKLIESGHIKF